MSLLFERFLNPERISMPDIDIDFCMNRRGEVIEYVTHKYGRENVAQIITFGTMAAKAAIKDVGRAMDMPYSDVDRIAKMVPTTLNIKLDDALKESVALQEAYQKDPQVRQLLDTARKLEGLVRNSGVHAAGVVISPRPLIELVPLHKTKNDEIVTAFDMVAIEKMGLLKMDFLGLTTLTILDDALKLIAQKGTNLKLDDIPLEDQETYEKVFHKGLTSGVFQFESHGMRDVLRRYQPNSIEDLTALNALYRPGPIQGGMIDDFIERKHGRRKIEYELPELKEILQETLGVIVYQEQVMQAANKLAGYSLGEADLLRRADGEEERGGDGEAARALCAGSDAARFSAEEDRKDFRSDGAICGIRVQQIAFGGLRAAGLSHGVFEDASSDRLHGGVADFGDRQHGRRGQVHQRMPRDGNCGRASRYQRQRRELYAAWAGDPLWAGRGEERGR